MIVAQTLQSSSSGKHPEAFIYEFIRMPLMSNESSSMKGVQVRIEILLP
jgi:hypothetical protein